MAALPRLDFGSRASVLLEWGRMVLPLGEGFASRADRVMAPSLGRAGLHQTYRLRVAIERS